MKSAHQHNSTKQFARAKPALPSSPCIIERSIKKSGISKDSFVRIMTQTALSRLKFWTQTDLERLLLAADSLNLDPLSMDIYAVPTLHTSLDSAANTGLQGGEESDSQLPVTIIVSLQGWLRIINSHPQFSGVSFATDESEKGKLPQWMECTLHRRDRLVPTTVREYMDEVNNLSGAWITHPRRMLRHKALIQCAKLAFGLRDMYQSENELVFSAKTYDHSVGSINRSGKRQPTDSNKLKTWLKTGQDGNNN
jgi:hypothetical protein